MTEKYTIDPALQAAAARSVAFYAPKSGLEGLKKEVCDAFHISVEDLEGRCRLKTFTLARKVFALKARVQCHSSLSEIGAALGGRDHTSVIHYLRTFPKDHPGG